MNEKSENVFFKKGKITIVLFISCAEKFHMDFCQYSSLENKHFLLQFTFTNSDINISIINFILGFSLKLVNYICTQLISFSTLTSNPRISSSRSIYIFS